MAPKGGRGGGSRGGGSSRSRGGSSWKSKGSSWKSKLGFGSKSKSKGTSSYPKQQGFTSYSSGGKTVSNSNWPKGQIPAAGTFPSKSSWGTNTYGMNKVSGMGSMGTASAMKNTMKQKGYYNTAVKLGAAYVGYKAAKGVGKTIGKAMWMGYPRIYGTQSHFYGMNSQYRYMGAVNDDCDVFYDYIKGTEYLRCDDWGSRKYSQYGNSSYNNVASTIMGIASWLFFTILICCCCCCGGCIYFFKKQSKSQSQGEDIDDEDHTQIPLHAQQPPPMFEPQNPYQSTMPTTDNSYNPYPAQANINPYPNNTNPYPVAATPQPYPAPAPFGQNPVQNAPPAEAPPYEPPKSAFPIAGM